MFTGPMFNAFCLLGAALLATRFLYRRFSSGGEAAQGPFIPRGENVHAVLRARYAGKAKFRAGVLAFSLAALGVYFGGGGRVIPILLLCGAALCQYGAMRLQTSAYLTQAMQQRFFEAKESHSDSGR